MTLAGARLKVSVWFILLREMYEDNTKKGCNNFHAIPNQTSIMDHM